MYPQFTVGANSFVLQTDAIYSAMGLGAVLSCSIEKDNKVIAYANRYLSKSKSNYSINQKECLTIVFTITITNECYSYAVYCRSRSVINLSLPLDHIVMIPHLTCDKINMILSRMYITNHSGNLF